MAYRNGSPIGMVGFCLCLLITVGCTSPTPSGPSPQLNPFPGSAYSYVVAYRMDGENANIIEKGELSQHVVGQGVRLSETQAIELLNIYNNTATYGGDFFRCFEPHLGFVLYDTEGVPVAHSTVCFLCNWMRTEPDIGMFVFSSTGRKKLMTLEGDVFRYSGQF